MYCFGLPSKTRSQRILWTSAIWPGSRDLPFFLLSYSPFKTSFGRATCRDVFFFLLFRVLLERQDFLCGASAETSVNTAIRRSVGVLVDQEQATSVSRKRQKTKKKSSYNGKSCSRNARVPEDSVNTSWYHDLRKKLAPGVGGGNTLRRILPVTPQRRGFTNISIILVIPLSSPPPNKRKSFKYFTSEIFFWHFLFKKK